MAEAMTMPDERHCHSDKPDAASRIKMRDCPSSRMRNRKGPKEKAAELRKLLRRVRPNQCVPLIMIWRGLVTETGELVNQIFQLLV